MTSSVCLRAFADAAGLPFAMPADREEYLPRLWRPPAFGTKADVAASSADCPLSEMMFEHLAPSCYLCGPSSILLEPSASASGALDELPAGDMDRAVLNISEVYAEICETAERIVACSPREWGHGKSAYGKRAYGKQACGMSAGG